MELAFKLNPYRATVAPATTNPPLSRIEEAPRDSFSPAPVGESECLLTTVAELKTLAAKLVLRPT